MEIREATVLDIGEMVREGERFLKWIYPEKGVDNINLYKIMYHFIKNGIVFIAEDDGVKKGAIGGLTIPNLWYPTDIYLSEIFVWVLPEFRNSRVGYKLIKRFIKYGQETPEISKVVMSIESNTPLNPDAYIKRGFELREQSFVMEV